MPYLANAVIRADQGGACVDFFDFAGHAGLQFDKVANGNTALGQHDGT